MRTRHLSLDLAVLLFAQWTALSGCASAGSPQSGQQQARPASYAPVHINLDAARATLTQPEAMCQRTLVADVVAGPPSATRWNTPDGRLPVSVASKGAPAVVSAGYFIYKLVTFSRLTVLRDQRHLPAQQYMTIGGQIGQDTYVLTEEPQLIPGTRYLVVFDHPGSAPGMPAGETIILSFPYLIDAQGMVILQHAGDPNQLDPGTVMPEIKYSLAYLKQLLASCTA